VWASGTTKESIEDIKQDATRPTYSGLDMEYVESTLSGILPAMRENVEAVWKVLRYIW
jgi:dTDP-4-dehydrorhamnose reductase